MKDTISQSELISRFNKATKAQKTALIELFGEDYFKVDITQRVKTFEDACAVLDLSANVHLPDVSRLPKQHANSVIAYYKLCIIAEALNEGWKPNWADTDECKWFPWWYVSTSGSNAGLAYANTSYAATYATASIGSRLGFKTEELAEYAAEQFKSLYETYLLGY